VTKSIFGTGALAMEGQKNNKKKCFFHGQERTEQKTNCQARRLRQSTIDKIALPSKQGINKRDETQATAHNMCIAKSRG